MRRPRSHPAGLFASCRSGSSARNSFARARLETTPFGGFRIRVELGNQYGTPDYATGRNPPLCLVIPTRDMSGGCEAKIEPGAGRPKPDM